LINIKNIIGERKGIFSVCQNLSKLSQKQEIEDDKYFRIAIQELEELAMLSLRMSKKLKIDFSPKSYPTAKVTNTITTYMLRDTLWNKSKGKILALSGTLRTKRTKERDSFEWVLIKSGLYTREEEKYKQQLYSMLKKPNNRLTEEIIEFYILQNKMLNERVKNIKFEYIPSLFAKSKTLSTITSIKELSMPKRKIYLEDEEKSIRNKNIEEDLTKRNINIAKFIANNFRTNALVLAVSYRDVKEIAEAIKKHDKTIKVIYHQEADSMNNNINAYIEAQNSGKKAILVGTEQYFIGLDLKGKKVENLFIARLPYNAGFPSGIKAKEKYPFWKHTKAENYFFKMLFKFMQGIGRLTRDFNDKGIIYILDDRMLTDKHIPLKDYLEEKTMLLPYEDILAKRESFEKNQNNPKTNLLALFYSYYPIINFKELIELLKIKDEEIKEIIEVSKKLVKKRIFISLIEKEELDKRLKSDKFNIWTLFGELLIIKYIQETNQETPFKTILENNFFDKDNFQELIKTIIIDKKNYPQIESFCEYANH